MADKRVQNRKKLQTCLRQLFQFDSADLDFGIYRFMNQKRVEIERFIEEDLLDAVEQGLAHFQAAEREELEAQLSEKREQLGPAAFDDTGAVRKEFRRIKIAQDYTELRRQLRRLDVAEETEARIFNDLWRFFSRYYDNGDFLTERRISSRDAKFCVPYNGEEVLLHWANRDQYYVKTSERFSDYRFTAGAYTVWFRLQRAEAPQNNIKGDKRYFVLRDGDSLAYDAETRTLAIYFEYRPITEEEEAHLLGIYNARQTKSDRRKTLDRSVLCVALGSEILNGLDAPDLKAHLAAVPEGKGSSRLGQHLNRYTARNTMDYFVHKNLGKFLCRELDFFLKNEVLRLDDVISDESGEVMQYVVTRMRVVRQIAHNIIAFLAQIEDFQKRLFEKRKFVVQTDYCVTLDRVPEAFYPEILANGAQLYEWRQLYSMDAWDEDLFWQGAFDKAFLQSHPYLMLDTAFFDADFKARLLATFDDLNAATDGLLIHGENFQALNLLMAKYGGQVKCIYIDPPYNTGKDEFLYKDNYQHSSWLTMMGDRLRLGRTLLAGDGLTTIHIDEHEWHRLRWLLADLCGDGGSSPSDGGNNLGAIVWDKRNPKGDATGVAYQHEYIFVWAKDALKFKADSSFQRRKKNAQKILAKAESLWSRVQQGDLSLEDANTEFRAWLRKRSFSGGEKAYNQIDTEGRVLQSVSMGWPNRKTAPPEYFVPLIHPTTKQPCAVPERGWRYPPETMQELVEKDEVLFGDDHTTIPRRKYYLDENLEENVSSLLYYGGSDDALISGLGLSYDDPSLKPLEVAKDLIEPVVDSSSLVCDFFAGSGTTAHAVMNLNREDGGERKYILVEMADYFDTVLKPRIQKVAFSANWKNGVPQDWDGMSHMFKYQRIESYEDALNNIRVRQPKDAQRRLLYDEFDDYQLHYMLDFETRDSPTLLTQEAFETPFDYTLKIQQGHESPEDTIVDLVETFHYLIGLHVQRLEQHEHQNRPYVVSRGKVRTERGIEKVVVIWRDTKGLDLEQEADWANEALLTELVDRVYVNGPSFINKAEPLEITFRTRLEGGAHGA